MLTRQQQTLEFWRGCEPIFAPCRRSGERATPMATPTASPSAADDAVDDRLEAVYAYSWDNIGTSALWGAVGGLALMLVFELKRSKRSVYWPKRKHMPHRSPSEMPLGLGAWVPTALMMPNEELLRKTGLDAYMMLRCSP